MKKLDYATQHPLSNHTPPHTGETVSSRHMLERRKNLKKSANDEMKSSPGSIHFVPYQRNIYLKIVLRNLKFPGGYV